MVNSNSNNVRYRIEPQPADALKLEEYRRLTRRHLGNLPALLTQVTRVESSVAWAPTWPQRWNEDELPAGSGLCREFATSDPSMAARCRECVRRHLTRTLEAGTDGHYFLCNHGVRNFWFAIIVRQCVVGIGLIRARDESATADGSIRAAHDVPAVARPGPARRDPRERARSMAAAEFRQVARLLQSIFHHAQNSALADLRKQDLTRARQALVEFQWVATRLRGELRRVIPALRPAAPAVQAEARSRQIVRPLLDRISREYARPITLRGCAAELGLNVSYLSHVFSSAVGMPFKMYLTELRLEKARELLSDPARSISDIAFAVGYASENRFRSAFRKATGLCPRLWRETLDMRPVTVPFLAAAPASTPVRG